ncbi:MAG TPA: hypothetical protein V6D28_25385 [Leptolyngbyaceae cyanobacterium]|nr:hypothetical protein [Nostocaceae cyanobacterium]
MCNAWNHPPGCNCGWRGRGGGNGRGIYTSLFSSPSKAASDENDYERSETYPTQCWWCGAFVFYHTNGYGDSVLFDSLGYPWEIHSCWETHWQTEKDRRRVINYLLHDNNQAEQKRMILMGAVRKIKGITFGSLGFYGATEDAVARQLGISIYQLRQDYGDIYKVDSAGIRFISKLESIVEFNKNRKSNVRINTPIKQQILNENAKSDATIIGQENEALYLRDGWYCLYVRRGMEFKIIADLATAIKNNLLPNRVQLQTYAYIDNKFRLSDVITDIAYPYSYSELSKRIDSHNHSYVLLEIKNILSRRTYHKTFGILLKVINLCCKTIPGVVGFAESESETIVSSVEVKEEELKRVLYQRNNLSHFDDITGKFGFKRGEILIQTTITPRGKIVKSKVKFIAFVNDENVRVQHLQTKQIYVTPLCSIAGNEETE